MNDHLSPGWNLPAPRLGPPTCTLCGRVGEIENDPLRAKRWDVAAGPVRWADPEEHDGEFGSAVRCRDHAGCRDRVHAHGLPWEVADGHENVGPTGRPLPIAVAADSVWDDPS